jgi:hypothetical protein
VVGAGFAAPEVDASGAAISNSDRALQLVVNKIAGLQEADRSAILRCFLDEAITLDIAKATSALEFKALLPMVPWARLKDLVLGLSACL